MLRYFGCEHGVNTFTVYTCLSYRIKKRKKGNDFQINQISQISQTYSKTCCYYRKQDSYLILQTG